MVFQFVKAEIFSLSVVLLLRNHHQMIPKSVSPAEMSYDWIAVLPGGVQPAPGGGGHHGHPPGRP